MFYYLYQHKVSYSTFHNDLVFLESSKKKVRWFLWVDVRRSALLSKKISYIFRILGTLVELSFGLLVTVGNITHQLKILESYIQECDFSTDPQNCTVFLNKLAKIFFPIIGRDQVDFLHGYKN